MNNSSAFKNLIKLIAKYAAEEVTKPKAKNENSNIRTVQFGQAKRIVN